jgi:hypothetical protein
MWFADNTSVGCTATARRTAIRIGGAAILLLALDTYAAMLVELRW